MFSYYNKLCLVLVMESKEGGIPSAHACLQSSLCGSRTYLYILNFLRFFMIIKRTVDIFVKRRIYKEGSLSQLLLDAQISQGFSKTRGLRTSIYRILKNVCIAH
jgi:hypothetical protein